MNFISFFQNIGETFNWFNSRVAKYNILTDEQNGFRGGRSTETASQSCIYSILEVLDNHLNAAVIFHGLSKAHDVLNHQNLLFKLEICGVSGVLKSWFKSHLINLIQFVEIAKIGSNNTMHRYSSLYIETTYVVAQVSVLEPICFLLYINYLPAYVQCANLVPYIDAVWLFDN